MLDMPSGGEAMKVLLESDVLQGIAKTGKQKFWKIRVVRDGDRYGYIREWWQEGSKHQESTVVWVEGKNVGRANATTDKEQAMLIIQRVVQKRMDKLNSPYLKPMLAEGFRSRQDDIRWPVFVQPKFDGRRMLMDGDNAWSRGLKDYNAEVVEHLMFDTGYFIVDGELMLPK